MGIDEMKARLASLKGTSLKLSAIRDEEADYAQQIVAEEERIDKEGREALRKLGLLRQAEALEKVPANERAHTMVECLVDWPTHKRTMKSGDIESGMGIIIVKALDRKAAAQALKTRGKAGDGGVALYDSSSESVAHGLMGATLYPDHGTLQLMLVECEPLCKSAHSAAVGLAGGFAHAISGKSDG
jgi:hypothetical protein